MQQKEVKVLAFTRKGRSKQLQQVLNEVRGETGEHVVDGPADSSVDLSYSLVDILAGIFSIFCYILDVVLEIRLALFYYANAVSVPYSEQMLANNKTMACQLSKVPDQSTYMIWFYVTVAFIVFPGIISGICSLSWHITDFQMRRKAGKSTPILLYFVRFLMPILMLGPVLHNIEAILFAIAASRSSKWHRKMYLYEQALFEDADAALLRIIECFLESMPQLVLQLHIVMASANWGVPVLPVTATSDIRTLPLCTSLPSFKASTENSGADPACDAIVAHFANLFPSLPTKIDCQLFLQFASMAATLLGAAWALVSYQRTVRRFLFSRRQMPLFPSCFVLFLAHCCLLSGRVIAVVLFVQVLNWGALCGLLAVHALIMFSWLHCGCIPKNRTKIPDEFCCSDSSPTRCWFNTVLSLMYTSAYVNVFDTPSHARYTFFFSVTLVENIAFILSWFFLTTHSPYSVISFTALVSVLILSLSLLLGGIFLLLIYYKFFHPNVFHRSKNLKMRKQNAVSLTSCN